MIEKFEFNNSDENGNKIPFEGTGDAPLESKISADEINGLKDKTNELVTKSNTFPYEDEYIELTSSDVNLVENTIDITVGKDILEVYSIYASTHATFIGNEIVFTQDILNRGSESVNIYSDLGSSDLTFSGKIITLDIEPSFTTSITRARFFVKYKKI